MYKNYSQIKRNSNAKYHQINPLTAKKMLFLTVNPWTHKGSPFDK